MSRYRFSLLIRLLVMIFFIDTRLAQTIQDSGQNKTKNLEPIFGKDKIGDVVGSGIEETPVGRSALLYKLLQKKLLFNQIHQPSPSLINCLCVPWYLCDANGLVIRDGSGVIDGRSSRTCSNDVEVCCYPRIVLPPATTKAPSTMPSITMTPTKSPSTSAPMIVYPSCVCVPIFQCGIYGGQPTQVIPGGGAVGIDPRQQILPGGGTCLGALVCCNNVPDKLIQTNHQSVEGSWKNIHSCATVTVFLFSYSNGDSYTACGLGYVSPVGIDPRMIQTRQGSSCPGPNSVCCALSPSTTITASVPPGPNIALSQLTDLATIPQTVSIDGAWGALAQANRLIKNQGTSDECICVEESNCSEENAFTYVEGLDPRFGPCSNSTLVCCRLQSRQMRPLRRADFGGFPTFPGFQKVVVQSQPECGTREMTYITVSSPMQGSTYFAEFPWMAILLLRRPGVNDTFQCGGSLINARTILTAAHCVLGCDPGTLIGRLGEWNTLVTNEPLPFQESPAQTVIVHPLFNPASLYNDIALVILAKPVTFAINVRPICMAAQGQATAAGTVCYGSGWGRSAFSADGMYQSILRKVDLPVVDNPNCQTRLRTTRLGQTFQLHPSFICAGGVANKDTCYKDGGGPLVCQDQRTGIFTQVGITSWGVGCGTTAPGVYTSVAQFRQWIDQTLMQNMVSG
ncbi:hypothetical protein QAD02_008763 [Eretmocerus hayati]|uniref:Uncharacterized protein n=1 Tax=Eretmocerus hayati TaxID=131215 RepID=A0ACC2N7Q7_9HYME|nr:hypothetical protein QAD02_008763 [Eretmocerus hayati]